MKHGFLLLDDGTLFTGWTFGCDAISPLDESTTDMWRPVPAGFFPGMGELVFNTGMTGYQEIVTDPSYSGQLVLMTSPHIGNYGVDRTWSESNPATGALGLICREYYTGPLPKGRESLSDYMKELGIPGISGINTRALTLHLRDKGSQNGIICQSATDTPSEAEIAEARALLATCPSMAGCSLIDDVGVIEPTETVAGTTKSANTAGTAGTGCNTAGSDKTAAGTATPKVAMLDCGVKSNIVREFTKRGVTPLLLPSTATWQEIMSTNPDGIFLSNGPGDPATLNHQVALAKQAIAKGVPLTGICLGHQIIAQALGAKTFKMKFGHHGCNHPVRDEETGKVCVTSQNHGFAVDPESLPSGVKVWFTNANDNSIEGIKDSTRPICSVQFHPEAAPGPHDASWIFDTFIQTMHVSAEQGGK